MLSFQIFAEELEKIENEELKTYCQEIHQMILERVKMNFALSSNMKPATVYAYFVLYADGSIKSLRIINKGFFFGNKELRELALKSVGDSVPFPPFPTSVTREKLFFKLPINIVWDADKVKHIEEGYLIE